MVRTTHFGQQLVGNSGKLPGRKHECGKWAMRAKSQSLGTLQFLPFDPCFCYALVVHNGSLEQRQTLV